LLNAAKDGFGLALGWSQLVEQALAAGSLVKLGPIAERRSHGYICHSRFTDNSVISPVIDWLEVAMHAAEQIR
jgi:DNA-binding transcriptional LysR family regulator